MGDLCIQKNGVGTHDFGTNRREHCVSQPVFPGTGQECLQCITPFPRLGSIAFLPIACIWQKSWQKSQARYSTFWDATTVLEKWAHMPLYWESIQEVRDRLIIIFRLLNLSRSIDLARTWRCLSQVGDQAFVLTQRKNQRRPQWEAVIK